MCTSITFSGLQNTQHTSNNQRRILIVDDEQDITQSFKLALEDSGFKVTTFNNPLLALSYFTASAYNVLLLDIRMPEMSGFEFYRKISVYFMTAFEEYYKEFKNASPTLVSAYFIRKPIETDHLVRELKSKLSSSSSSPA